MSDSSGWAKGPFYCGLKYSSAKTKRSTARVKVCIFRPACTVVLGVCGVLIGKRDGPVVLTIHTVQKMKDSTARICYGDVMNRKILVLVFQVP